MKAYFIVALFVLVGCGVNAANITNITYVGRGITPNMSLAIQNLTKFYSDLYYGPGPNSFYGISRFMSYDLAEKFGNNWSVFDGYASMGGIYYKPLNDTVMVYDVVANEYAPVTRFHVWLSAYGNLTALQSSLHYNASILQKLMKNNQFANKLNQLEASLIDVHYRGSGVDYNMQNQLTSIAVNQATTYNLNTTNVTCNNCNNVAQQISLQCQNSYGGNWTTYVILTRSGDGTLPVFKEQYLSLNLLSNNMTYFVVMGRSN